MTVPSTSGTHPGLSVGPTSEFSLFFRVKPGEGPALRSALSDLQDTPGYRPGDYGMAIQTIHEARFVLFDDDTRLAFVTSFDGPWDAYMEDFFTSGPTLELFDVIFRHTEGYDGLPDLAAVKAFVLGAEQTAAAYARNYGGTVKEIRKAQRVNAAFQQVLDHPAGRGGPPAPGAAAAAGRGLRLGRDQRPGTSRRCLTTSPVRGPWPTRSRTSPTSTRSRAPRNRRTLVLVMNTLPFAQPEDLFSDGLIYRFRLRPLTAAVANGTGRRSAPSEDELVVDCVFSDRRAERRPRAGGHLHPQHGRIGLVPGRRPRWRLRTGDQGVRRRALGPVHHGRPRGAEDDRDPEAVVHRPRRDLPRRQERAQPRGRDRHRTSWGTPR